MQLQQIGTPFDSIEKGIGMTAFFGVFTAGIAYKAYYKKDYFAAACSAMGFAITGLAIYNTMALGLSGDIADTLSHDFA